MWRKNTGAKPSPQASIGQDTAQAQANPQATQTTPATPATQAAGPAAAPAPAQTTLSTPQANESQTRSDEAKFAAAAVELEKQIAIEEKKAAAEAKPGADEPAVAEKTTFATLARELDLVPSRVCGGIKIHGEISGNTDLFIDGEVQGKLSFVHASVTVGPQGRVQGDIDAREILVEGVVQGTLRAAERVRLGGASRVKGNLTSPRIAIEDGARLSGKVETARPGEKSEAREKSGTGAKGTTAKTALKDAPTATPATAKAVGATDTAPDAPPEGSTPASALGAAV